MRYQLKFTNEVNSLDKHGYTATPYNFSTYGNSFPKNGHFSSLPSCICRV